MDELIDGVEKLAGDISKELEDYLTNNLTRDCERLEFLFTYEETFKKRYKARMISFNRPLRKLRKKDPDLYRYLKMTQAEVSSFCKELSDCQDKVMFIDDLFKCGNLKYNSPPATIAAIARELFKKHPLETEQIATKIVDDRVSILLYIHDAEQKFLLQDWLQSFETITEYSSIFDDLKLLQEDEKFCRFEGSGIEHELEKYKWFLVKHGGKKKAWKKYRKHIMDKRDRITKLLHKKPYDNENSIFNLAARVVHGEYVIEDVKREILKLKPFYSGINFG